MEEIFHAVTAEELLVLGTCAYLLPHVELSLKLHTSLASGIIHSLEDEFQAYVIKYFERILDEVKEQMPLSPEIAAYFELPSSVVTSTDDAYAAIVGKARELMNWDEE